MTGGTWAGVITAAIGLLTALAAHYRISGHALRSPFSAHPPTLPPGRQGRPPAA